MNFIQFLSFVYLFGISVCLECGEYTNYNNILTERIVGGINASPGEFPWQVSMQRQAGLRAPRQWGVPGPAIWPAPGVWPQPGGSWQQPVHHTVSQIRPIAPTLAPPGGWATPPPRPVPYPPGQLPGQIVIQPVKPQPTPIPTPSQTVPHPHPQPPQPQPQPHPQPHPQPQPQPHPQPQPPPRPPTPSPSVSSGRWQHFCGGSVINENWILTAAHCVESMKYSYTSGSIRIVLGTIDWRNTNTGSPQIIAISRIVVHDGWNRNTGQNDIALLHTSSPIQFQKAPDGVVLVNKVCLSSNPNTEYTGNAISSGWGYLNKNSRVSPDLLRKVEIPVIDFNTCKNAFSRVIGVTLNQVCAGQAPKGNCMGDSGGPLVQTHGNKATQIGIVSFSIPCAVHGYPDVFTKVSKYLDWINQNAGITSMG